MSETKFYSKHIFVFPFRYQKKEKGKKENLYPDLKEIKKHISSDFWEEFEFRHKIYDNYHTYNEFVYFFPQVRDVLNLKDTEEDKILNVLQYQYRKTGGLTPEYEIHIKNSKKENEIYSLEIEDVTLNFYPNGIGMFVFHLKNNKYPFTDAILKINDYGRRIFPQYLGSYNDIVDAPKDSFLADKIILRNLSTEFGTLIEEDFSYYNDLDRLNAQAFRLPKHIGMLLGSAFYSDTQQKTLYRITPILDDRMFTVSFYLNSAWMGFLEKWNKTTGTYAYKTDETWYQYIFVDGKYPSVRNKELLKKQLEEHTYARWLEGGQLYGMSRYSFVFLGSDERFHRNVLDKHISTLYFQMVLLVLLQRAYLVYFGGEVARLANKLEHTENLEDYVDEINRLYLDYIKFINRIYFREASPQEQGIELYEMMQEKMRIKRDVDDLEREIGDLNEYVERYQERRLTRLAAKYLPVTLLAGILGMNTITGLRWNFNHPELWPTVFGILNVIIVGYAIWILTRQFITKKL